MALLKRRLKAASLMESLTATVIIVVVFMIASLSLNNILRNEIRNNSQILRNRVAELMYFIEQNKIVCPFSDQGKYWVITIEQDKVSYIMNVRNKRNDDQWQIIVNR